MADPVATEIAGGIASTATVTASFPARTAGQLLILTMGADDYRATTGTLRPESSGWTYLDGRQGNLGFYVWWKIATGGETSVSYRIGSGAKSAYAVTSVSNIDGASPLGANAATAGPVTSGTTGHTTASIAPTAAVRWIVVASVGSTGNNTNGPYTWAAPFVKLSERYNTSGYRPGVTVATRVMDGGTATSGAVTFAANGDQGMSVIAAWRNSTASSTPNTGTASGSWSFTGTASGKRSPKSSGVGAVGWSGAATGKRAPRGAGSGAIATTGTASGRRVPKGGATGSVSWSGAATGKRAPKAIGAGALAWSSSATGSTPAVGAAGGVAVGSLAWSGSAAGKRTPKASAVGTLAFTGSAFGTAPVVADASGVAVGNFAWHGSATGKRHPLASAAGVWGFVGTAYAVDASIAPPAFRRTVVEPEIRVLVVVAESRTLTIDLDPRNQEA